jgi:hypothetical protein
MTYATTPALKNTRRTRVGAAEGAQQNVSESSLLR